MITSESNEFPAFLYFPLYSTTDDIESSFSNIFPTMVDNISPQDYELFIKTVGPVLRSTYHGSTFIYFLLHPNSRIWLLTFLSNVIISLYSVRNLL